MPDDSTSGDGVPELPNGGADERPGSYTRRQGPYSPSQERQVREGPYSLPYGQGFYGYTDTSQGTYGDPGYRYAWPYVPPPPPRPPVSAEERRRQRRRLLVFGVVLLLAIGAGTGIGAVIAPTNPRSVAASLLHQSVSAAAGASSYHYRELSTLYGAHDDITGVALRNGGRQLINQQCKTGTSIFDLRLVNGIVYFRGNQAAVLYELGVASTKVASLTDRWVKVTRGESPYKTFAVGIKTKSNISQLTTAFIPFSSHELPGSSPSSTEITGALQTRGKPVGTADLVISRPNLLPRTFRGSAVNKLGRYNLSWRFNKYGEKVSVAAPNGAIPFSSLHAKGTNKSACA